MGRGVFTTEDFPPNALLEVSPVLVMDANARKLLDQTELYNYIFEWGEDSEKCCVAWGYISMYNHRFNSNCEYMMDYEQNIMMVRTVRQIAAGEELFINYNGDWDNNAPLWFDAK